jgi:hypothetical protein
VALDAPRARLGRARRPHDAKRRMRGGVRAHGTSAWPSRENCIWQTLLCQ